jgi:hypothetical protein
VKIKLDTSGLGQSRWYEYLARFVFGSAVTAFAGLIAKRFGPEIGGLFLAFPAIFPATATLIEKHEQQKHEKQKNERAGESGMARGRAAAGVDAAGAAIGSIGLAAFALVVWLRLPASRTSLALIGATFAWFVTSVSVWEFREMLWRRARTRRLNALNRPPHDGVHHHGVRHNAEHHNAEQRGRSTK